MPVPACAALLAITRNVPNNKTNKCCVYFGSDCINLKIEKKKIYKNYLYLLFNVKDFDIFMLI